MSTQVAGQRAVGEEEVVRIAQEAYIYLYPLVIMDVTRRVATNVPLGVKPGLGPPNVFSHMREFPPGDFKEVVRPNFDTLYSSAWLDLSDEPVIVSVADTEGRYYMLPMLDMWTDVFAVPGSRTTGSQAAHFAVVPRGWGGSLPDGVTRIEAPTPHVWIIGRTQTNGPSDYASVHEVQDGYVITPLSRWPGSQPDVETTVDLGVDMDTAPLDQINGMPGSDFFSYAAELMKLHPPHITDQPIVARMRRIGIEAGESLDLELLGPSVRAALDSTPAAALETMRAAIANPNLNPVVNGWVFVRSDMGVYGTNYLRRAVIAMVGLGANLPEDAVYPLLVADSSGEEPVGDNSYVLRFAAGELPPVGAFWSVTMYDADGFPAANPVDRYALGDRDPLQFNPDGSLDIHVRHERLDPDRETNWLPAPKGPLGITLRLYAPLPEVLDGRWTPPTLQRL